MDQTTYTGSTVSITEDWKGERVVYLQFVTANREYNLNIDKATAARLIRQLRKVLDDDYDRSINERLP